MPDMHELLRYTIEKHASDLHITTGSPVMVRVHGSIRKIDKNNLSHEDVRNLVGQILKEDQLAVLEESHELDFALHLPDIGRFRVNVFHQRKGVAAVFRIIPQKILSLETLGLPDTIKSLIGLDYGLILVTGPTGSGKSTTLAAMIDYINSTKEGHIITIEDPIEFIHHTKNCAVNQREIGSSTHSFANALRSALREDPDYVLVGEMRDLETISLALTAAETGHLVFGTLHTSSAAKTITRVIDVFPADEQDRIRVQLSESLQGIIAQRLYPRKDKPGRVAAYEILIATQAIRNLVREKKIFQIESVIQTSKQMGMQNMEQSKRKLVADGIISADWLHERMTLY
jgi:twitching motility protein PilT